MRSAPLSHPKHTLHQSLPRLAHHNLHRPASLSSVQLLHWEKLLLRHFVHHTHTQARMHADGAPPPPPRALASCGPPRPWRQPPPPPSSPPTPKEMEVGAPPRERGVGRFTSSAVLVASQGVRKSLRERDACSAWPASTLRGRAKRTTNPPLAVPVVLLRRRLSLSLSLSLFKICRRPEAPVMLLIAKVR